MARDVETFAPPNLLEMLRAQVAAAGTPTIWAAQHGVTRALVSMTLAGNRPVSDAIANALGFMRPAYFIRKDATP